MSLDVETALREAKLIDFVTVEDGIAADIEYIIVRPKRWLGRQTWGAITSFLKETFQGFEWVKLGKESHWRTALTNVKQPTKAVPIDKMMPPQTKEVSSLVEIPTDQILSMPFVSRQAAEDLELTDLAGSMQAHGVLEPLLVRRKPSGNIELVAGHRRLAAAKIAGLKHVPCVLREMTDQEAYEAHLIENLQRKDLNDYEKARMLDYLLKKFPEAYPTQQALAARVGKSKAWVSQHLAMLQLEKVHPGEPIENLTERQARAILQAPKQVQKEVIKKVQEDASPPSARKIEEMAKPKPEKYDVGEFDCPKCGFKGMIVHIDPNKHKFVRVTED